VETSLPCVPVERVVRFGDPEEEILVEAEVFGADLIALTANRRNRLLSAIAPDIAERVAGKSPVPAVVLRG
jgi:nucleotide-binding universal stress UspA family protein